MEFASRQLSCPVDVFVGDNDEFVDQAVLGAWAEVRSHIIPGADHFFMGRSDQLRTSIEASLRSKGYKETPAIHS